MARTSSWSRVLAWLERTIFVACADPGDAECRRQAMLAHGFSFAGILACCVFTVECLLRGDLRQAWVLAGICLLTIVCLLHFRFTRRFLPSATVAVAGVGVFMLYMLASGGTDGSGSVWAFAYPPMALFSMGHRRGMLLAGIFVAAAAAILWLDGDWLGYAYTPAFRDRYLGALVFVAVVSTVSEWLRSSSHQRLEQEVLVRRRTERKLQAAKEEAEEAARAKGVFLANMSHELRTPLTSLLGLNELLLAGELKPGQRDVARTMRKSGKHLMAIVNDVLDLAKMDAGQLVVERVPFEPGELARETCVSFGAAARERGLTLGLEIHGQLPAMVIGDPRRIRQVLSNLIGNGLKFTLRGGVMVRLEQIGGEPSLARLRWTIQDTGVGVPDHLQERIFEEYQQGEQGSSPIDCGTGLGLAISRRLIEAMDGVIRLSSQPGLGSSFWFELDLPVDQSRTESVVLAGEGEPAGVRGLPWRLLVVEDDPNNRYLLQLVFQRLGARVELAGDGREALAKYADADFDLILMDCHMPRMDGFQATRAIRRAQAELGRQHIPIIAVTANVTEENQARCTASGMDGCLLKPFEADTLEETVRRWLEG